MNLSYRGIAYHPASPVVEATETEQVGHFLGKSYKMVHSNIVARHSSTPLRYRGTTYSS